MFDLTDRRTLFVGGKGGVGKTTVAASLALRMADLGRRCLVVSTDPAHSLGDVFGEHIGGKQKELAPNLLALEIDPEAEADKFMAGVTNNLRSLVHPDMYHEVERQMKLARTAPGSVEAAMLERVSAIMTAPDPDWEVVIFDTAPTGQTLRLLALPEIMTAWTEGMLKHREKADELGRALDRFKPDERDHFAFMDPMQPHNTREDVESTAADAQQGRFVRIRETLMKRRDTFAAARSLLLDRKRTGFVLVLNAEKLPILESQKALVTLREFGMPVAGVVVNRVLPRDEPGKFLDQRRQREAGYLTIIEESFADIKRVFVPMFASDVGGIDALRAVAKYVHV